MQTTLLNNDAFRELANLLRKAYGSMPNKELINRVINRADEERIYIERDYWGRPLQDWADATGYGIEELFNLMFPKCKATQEALEFFSALVFFGTGDCPCCGYELSFEREREGKFSWENIKCNNCGYANTTCPDFETLQGGKDY